MTSRKLTPKPHSLKSVWELIDKSKPLIVAIGHNVAGVTYIMDYMEDNNLTDKMEIAGLCCTAFDMSRYKEV